MEEPASWKLAGEFFIPGKDLEPKARQRYALISRALHDLGASKQRLLVEPAFSSDEDFVVMKACFNADAFCEHYQSINRILNDLVSEIKLISKDLSATFEKSRLELTEFVASLLAYTCRTVYLQESFCCLSKKCRDDVALFEERAKQAQARCKQLEFDMTFKDKENMRVIEELQTTIRALNEDAERTQANATQPWWLLNQGVSDPKSDETSKEWYESELSYYRDIASQREIKNQMLFNEYKALLEKFETVEERCKEQTGVIAALDKKIQAYELESQTKAQTTCSSSQTPEEQIIKTNLVRPAVVSRGGAAPKEPICLVFSRTDMSNNSKRNLNLGSCSSPRFTLCLPPKFHLMYDEENRQARLEVQREGLRGRVGGRLSISHRRASSARIRDGADLADGADALSFKEVMRRALCGLEEAVVMNLRKTSAAIGEVWAGLLSMIHSTGGRGLGMSSDFSSSTEVPMSESRPAARDR